MKYIQIKNGVPTGTFTVGTNVVWDDTHYCPADKLTPEESQQFGVFALTAVDRPSFNPITQSVSAANPALVDGVWTQQWVVSDLDAATIAANQATAAQALQASIVAATQKRLDDFAHTRNYDGILSACTYATSAVPRFKSEGQYAVDARDNTWVTLYALLADVEAGNWQMPTGFDDVEHLLPVLVWPA